MNKILLIFLGFAILLLGFLLASKLPQEQAMASLSQNVSGWAWSETTGWLSFNCQNCYNNPACDKTAVCNGSHLDYGVDIAQNGVMSGKAWAEHIGYLTFNEAELVGCPTAPCRAWVDLNTGFLSGWARALSAPWDTQSGGWDGWVRLRNGASYGVYIDFADSKQFKGFAWGGGGSNTNNAVIGWVSFNSKNSDSDGDGTSDTGNYPQTPPGLSVEDYETETSFSFPPTATNLSAVVSNMCSSPSMSLSWVFEDLEAAYGDTQSAYQAQVDKEGTFAVFGNGELNTGKVVSGSLSQAVLLVKNAVASQLDYNTLYRWRVKVWDSFDTESVWANGANFQTPLHIYPTPQFKWLPAYPSQDETVQLCAVSAGDCASFLPSELSICYDNSNNEISCTGKTFNWVLPPQGQFETGSTASSENPKVKFNAPGLWKISLTITDSVGSCTLVDKEIRVIIPLPKWKETSPN
ncbi:hypothetical protein L6252_00430 [Candidatus Parcubacteria bacterium]|nr:hypothetical protein [Candidatus Parcubacteria bacterium]